MDAANVDLKAFTDDFYVKLSGAHLQPVLDTLVYLKHETDVWLEITTLLIPGHERLASEIDALMCQWIGEGTRARRAAALLARSIPDYKMTRHRRPRRRRRCTRARDIALGDGPALRLHRQRARPRRRHHLLPGCGAPLIVRDWYRILATASTTTAAAGVRRGDRRAASTPYDGRSAAGCRCGWRSTAREAPRPDETLRRYFGVAPPAAGRSDAVGPRRT